MRPSVFPWYKSKVLIIQAEMTQYRVPFFKSLSDALSDDGIRLSVALATLGIRTAEMTTASCRRGWA
jgi:hypothetical protein